MMEIGKLVQIVDDKSEFFGTNGMVMSKIDESMYKVLVFKDDKEYIFLKQSLKFDK